MCYIPSHEYSVLTGEIDRLVNLRKMFTGHDVAQAVMKMPNASEKVRVLFNNHDECFVGYGCYPVENGPLLYFPVSKSVQNRADKIQSAIMDKADEMPEDDQDPEPGIDE
jgi:hypothetical protein